MKVIIWNNEERDICLEVALNIVNSGRDAHGWVGLFLYEVSQTAALEEKLKIAEDKLERIENLPAYYKTIGLKDKNETIEGMRELALEALQKIRGESK